MNKKHGYIPWEYAIIVCAVTLLVVIAGSCCLGVLVNIVKAKNGKEARQKTDYAVKSQGHSIVRFLDVFGKKDD